MWICFETEASLNRLCESNELCENIVFISEASLQRREEIVVFCVPIKTVVEHSLKDFGDTREKRDRSVGSWVRFLFPGFMDWMNNGKLPLIRIVTVFKREIEQV